MNNRFWLFEISGVSFEHKDDVIYLYDTKKEVQKEIRDLKKDGFNYDAEVLPVIAHESGRIFCSKYNWTYFKDYMQGQDFCVDTFKKMVRQRLKDRRQAAKEGLK